MRKHLSAPSRSPAHSEELYRHFAALVESSSDAIISKDLNGIIQSWNKGAQRLFGYTAPEVIGKSITILMPERCKAEEERILSRIRRGERVEHYETVRQHKDGSLVDISLTVSPIKDQFGTVIGASKIARDITDRKSARKVDRLLSAIVESSDDAIISKDLNGTIQSWNRAAERIFGYTEAEVLGKSITLLMPPDRKQEEEQILARIRRGERVEHYETVRQRKDGSLVDISVTISPIRDSFGTVVGASKIARDISERKQAEAIIERSRRELANINEELEQRVLARTASLNEAMAQMEEFSYTVSHDLRSPLRAIQGYARVALEDYGNVLDERGRDHLQKIITSSRRMDKLIHDVLVYSRVARTDVELRPINLDLFVREIIQQYPDMQPPRATIHIQSPLLTVLAHESALTQALSNLLGNAVKFVAEGIVPRVDVRTEPRGAYVRLWITDNGIGIKPEHRSRLFKMFERVTQDPRYEGTGIGLAIVRKAVEKMGGSVGLESDGMNGSSFWMDLRAVE